MFAVCEVWGADNRSSVSANICANSEKNTKKNRRLKLKPDKLDGPKLKTLNHEFWEHFVRKNGHRLCLNELVSAKLAR